MPDHIKLDDDVLHYCLDSLVVRNGVTHGHGWAFFAATAAKTMRLEITGKTGDVTAIEATHGQRRDDVRELYGDLPNAHHSGFRFHGSFPATAVSANMVIESVRGEVCRIPLDIRNDGDGLRLKSRQLAWIGLLGKAWRLVRRGHFRRLLSAVAGYAARVPRRVDNLVELVAGRIAASGKEDAVLTIDHDLGGGANMYRERLLVPLVDRGECVLLLSFFMPTLQFVLECRTRNGTERFALASLDDIVVLAKKGLLREVFYNNAVSFHDPMRIPELLARLKTETGVPMRIALHDYFPICPSFFLLDYKGRYCDLPATDECNRCLREHDASLVRLAGVDDIVEWRAAWGTALEATDEVLCYSGASRAILQRAYPAMNPERITLRPHAVDYLPQRRPKIATSAQLHIGILGHLTHAKGALVVRDLINEIHARRLSIPVTVIGTVDAQCHLPNVAETGRYTPETLADTIERSGANLFLFPSIWPETFSYVVSELIALNLPVACFNLGAPAERVRNYPLGCIVPYNESGALLDALLTFHARLEHASSSLSENTIE